MQERLGRNTSAVQANSTGFHTLINQNYLHSVIGCGKRCRISARTTTQNNQLDVLIRH
jgi:hypothetical protein